jgi:hypothetical protein
LAATSADRLAQGDAITVAASSGALIESQRGAAAFTASSTDQRELKLKSSRDFSNVHYCRRPLGDTASELDFARAKLRGMSSNAIKARIESGRVIVDERADLPDGEVYLVPVERGDMDPAERARVEAIIEESILDEQAGRTEDFFGAINELRSRT